MAPTLNFHTAREPPKTRRMRTRREMMINAETAVRDRNHDLDKAICGVAAALCDGAETEAAGPVGVCGVAV